MTDEDLKKIVMERIEDLPDEVSGFVALGLGTIAQKFTICVRNGSYATMLQIGRALADIVKIHSGVEPATFFADVLHRTKNGEVGNPIHGKPCDNVRHFPTASGNNEVH